eukprot:SAG11_NODE_37545_length_256_cov_0.987261_2_plen_42_part_01
MCTTTDVNGLYMLNAPPGMEVYLKLTRDRDDDEGEHFARSAA